MNISPASLARALGGEVRGNQVLAPGPGHSPADRSLSVLIDDDAPDGFVVKTFSPRDDEMSCRDYVRERAGLPHWEPRRSNDNNHFGYDFSFRVRWYQRAFHEALVQQKKKRLREFRDEVMTGVRDLKGSVSTLHERMDRFIEGDKMGRPRRAST